MSYSAMPGWRVSLGYTSFRRAGYAAERAQYRPACRRRSAR
ncbi:hypothetical protein GBP346_A2069 [Burkholderia pseudomallei MSHR346]|nr:hypothetical protein GBP346_A2069 [Burkholderia pseudomallei MSHR346]